MPAGSIALEIVDIAPRAATATGDSRERGPIRRIEL
jgi:hypothetical protein